MSNGTLTGTATSDPFDAPPRATVQAEGNFGSGSVTLQYKAQNGSWYDLAVDGGTHVMTASVTRAIGNERLMTMRLSSNSVTSVYWEVR